MSEILTDIAAELHSREAHKAVQFQELVAAVVDGDVDAAHVADELDRLDRTAGELQQAVSYAEQRLAWRAEADELQLREQEWGQAKGRTEEKRKELLAIQDQLGREIQSLAEAEQAALRLVSASYRAVAELRKSYRGPALDKLTQVQQKERELADQLNAAKARRSRAKWYSRGPLATIGAVSSEEIKACEARVATADRDIGRISGEIEEAKRQAAAIERGMLQP